MLIAGAALALLTPALRAGQRAFVNMETIFEGYYKTIRANAAFEQKKQDFQDRVDILRDELRSMVGETKKLDEEANNDLLSEDARQESKRKLQLRLERLRAKEEEYRQFRSSGLQELQKTRLSAEEDLIDDLSEFVRKFCREKGYDLVYDVTGKSLNRMPVLLLYPEEEEITDQILKAINLGHEDELEKAKADLEAMEKSRDPGTDAPRDAGTAAEQE
jgi:Skp family chaperone for outer membrane proteins